MAKTYASKANFVTKEVETTNAVLGILKIMVLDKAKARDC
jgi:hypothetical protein